MVVLEKLQVAISKERLGRYLRAASGDLGRAIALYELNVALSQTLYGVLHGYEITLRNSMHDQLKKHFGQDNWYEKAPLNPIHVQAITEAKRISGTVSPSAGKVVAELHLGFWTGLTAGKYQPTLWVPCLSKAFPNTKPNRAKTHARLSDVKTLRNRVAHHERILGRCGMLSAGIHPVKGTELLLRPEDVLDTVAWICNDTAQWIRKTTRFDDSRALLNSPLARNSNL